MLLLPKRRAIDYVKAHGRRTGDVMTREVITVNDDASLEEIAELLERHRIKRVPVISSAAPISCMAWSHVEPVAFLRRTDRNLKAAKSAMSIRMDAPGWFAHDQRSAEHQALDRPLSGTNRDLIANRLMTHRFG